MMNILYLAHRIPYPPNKGDKIRSFHQVRYLSSRHAVHLACLIDAAEDLQCVEHLQKYCAYVTAIYRPSVRAKALALIALPTKTPLSVRSFFSRHLRRSIMERLEAGKIDCIFVFSSQMAEYVLDATGIPRIIDFVDVDSEKWRFYSHFHRIPLSWVYHLEANRLAAYEQRVAMVFDRTLFVSDAEAQLFRQNGGEGNISVITNGVDLDYFAPPVVSPASLAAPIIAFSGAMDYYPNIDAVRYFCQEIFPRIRRAIPAVAFHIIGRNPSPQVKALHRPPYVITTGTVPDIRPYLGKARVAVAPFRIARGIPNKVLEAMAMGLPVVGTSISFQGTRATTSDGVRVADDAQAFAGEVIGLLTDATIHSECSLLARRYVERNHRWEEHGRSLEALLQVNGS